MRLRRYGVHGGLKRGMACTLTLVLTIMAGKAVLETDPSGAVLRASQGIDEMASGWIGLMWRQQYPILDSETDWGWWESWQSAFFMQSPLVRMLEMQEDQNHNPYEEIDPSYASYVTGQELYSEYQYLFQYGGEDTNAQEMPEDMAGDQSVQTVQEGNDGGILSPSLLQSNGVHIARQGLPVVGTEYVMEQLADYDFLMKHFYSVHASTTATREQMDAEKMLEDLTMPIEEGKPQILIYHTHSQEAFADSGPGETVVGMGSYLTELLEAKGYTVIHDTSVYDLRGDVLDRNKAYSYAEEGIARILQENPSIQVVLDLHRDGVNEKLHLVSEVNGKPTAQIMFFNGMSQTPEGPIEYLPNPYREDNLAFSFQMQLNAAAYYPGLTRKIYLKGLRYNMHYRPRSALVEVGAQTNTYQEALNAMEPLAELLDMVLQGH